MTIPFGKWPNFDACVADMKSQGYTDEQSRGICGKIQAQHKAKTGEMSEEKPDWDENLPEDAPEESESDEEMQAKELKIDTIQLVD